MAKAEPIPQDEPELKSLLKPLISDGCTFKNWYAYQLMSSAAAYANRFPNSELIDRIRIKFYEKCGLSKFTAEDLAEGFDEWADARAAKAQAMKDALEKQKKQMKKRRFMDQRFSQKDVDRIDPDIDILDFVP